MTDLCSVCQQNSTAILRSANQPEEEKSEVSDYNTCNVYSLTFKMYQLVKSAEMHLTAATEARSYMRSQVELAKKELEGEDAVGSLANIHPLIDEVVDLNNNKV